MNEKVKEIAKDSAVGVGIGCAVIIPGISAGTIAVITNTFQKIVNAVDGLFTKKFWSNLLTLLPFGLVGVITVAVLIKPLNAAMDACLFGVLALFGGFIAGSVPGVVDEVKDAKPNKLNISLLIVGFIVASLIGVLSIFCGFSSSIESLFASQSVWLYISLLLVGVLGSTGLIVPGFSGSALLLVIGFYKPILEVGSKVISFGNDFWAQLSLLATFALGVLIGFVLFSRLMNFLLNKHRQNSFYVIIGFVCGSLISIFLNSNTLDYVQSGRFGLLDTILTPFLLIVGFVIAYLFVRLNRKKSLTDKRK